MPSSTFENLSEDKKERIIAGAMKEFSKHSLNNASISNIVKYSQISRGSFYQYFEDKDDLYLYLTKKFQHNYRKVMVRCFKSHNGDFYKGYLEFGTSYIQAITESEKFGFFENLYLNMNYETNKQSANLMYSNPEKPKRIPKGKRVIDLIDYSSLTIQTDEEIIDLMKFLISVLNQTIMEGFWEKMSLSKTQQLFKKRLDWICQGVQKSRVGDEVGK